MAENEDELMRPIVESWLGVIEESVRAKKDFTEVSSMCRKFYGGLTGFMWKPEFRGKYFSSISVNPKFAVTLNKSFELCAIFAPYLYWKYPHRTVTRYEPLPLYPDLFGDAENPLAQQLFQFVQAQTATEERAGEMRNAVMERYLNYAQREQPGGLALHSQLGITDALIAGRGCLWTDSYRFPGSESTLTQSTFDPVSNLLIDPDCTDPTLNRAQFIIRKHTNSTWQAERLFKMPRGSLLGKGQFESDKTQGGVTGGNKNGKRKTKQTFDLIVWYEIFSKCGVGTRIKGTPRELERRFDKVVGDYARICVAKGISYPLNCHPERLRRSYDDEVQGMFDWPVPYWKDNRWPCSVLDFYYDSESAWPIPPLAPGLGELICLNVLTSVAVSMTFEHSREIIAVLGAVAAEVEEALNSTNNPAVIKLSATVGKSIKECVEFLQRPEINGDVWKTIEYLTVLFDKRTGLSELLYSMNVGGVQSRSAEDAKIKQNNATVRPDHMASQVAKWQTSIAETEKICAHWKVKSSDVRRYLGPTGAMIWKKYIEDEDPEIVFREMRCMVDAGDHKKPNKERETDNLQNILQFAGQQLNDHATATGDTEPLNQLYEMLGDATDQPLEKLRMGPRVPMPPAPEMVQMQQEQMQLEMEKLRADAMKSQADAQSKQDDAALKREQFAMDAATQERELQFEAVEGQQEMQLEREKTEQELQLEQMKAYIDMAVEKAKAQFQLQLQQAQGAQQLRQQEESHQQQQKQGALEFVNGLTQSRMEHTQKMQQARQQSKPSKSRRNGKA